MGNYQSTTLEGTLPALSYESLEKDFNSKVTGVDPQNKDTKLMTRADFAKQFPTLSNQRIFGQNAFTIFDTEQNGEIDFSQFFCGLTVLLNAKVDTKIDTLFRLLDPAGNEVLQEYEVLGFIEKTIAMMKELDSTVEWDEPLILPKTQQELLASFGASKNPKQQQQNITPEALFSEQHVLLGPLEVCCDSVQMLNYGFASLGKGALPSPLPNQGSSGTLNVGSLAQGPMITSTVKRGRDGAGSNNNSSKFGHSNGDNSNNNSTITPSIDDQLDLSTSKSLRPQRAESNHKLAGTTQQTTSASSAATPATTGTRTLTKREFIQFIHNVPQLLFIVVWAMNVSLIQHICKQTRLEFVHNCETLLVSQFPLNEHDLLTQYQRLSHFFYEVLLRRLGLVNQVQSTSLLQQDLTTIQKYFSKTDSTLNDPLNNGLASGQHSAAATPTAANVSSSPFRRGSKTNIFGRKSSEHDIMNPIHTTTISEDGTVMTINGAQQILLPKISPLTYPFTYHLSDLAVTSAVLHNSLISSSTKSKPGDLTIDIDDTNPRASPAHMPSTPRLKTEFSSASLTATPANNNNTSPTNITQTDATGFLTTTDQDLYNNVLLSTCATLSVTSCYQTPTTNGPAVDLAKLGFFPDTIPFFLYFTQVFKLRHMIHRNRIASRTKCVGLLENIKHHCNTTYVDLITQQYLYEIQLESIQSQRKTTLKDLGDGGTAGDLNTKLLQVLNERTLEKTAEDEKNKGKSALENTNGTPPGKMSGETESNSNKDNDKQQKKNKQKKNTTKKKVIEEEKDDDNDDDDGDSSDSLSLGGIEELDNMFAPTPTNSKKIEKNNKDDKKSNQFSTKKKLMFPETESEEDDDDDDDEDDDEDDEEEESDVAEDKKKSPTPTTTNNINTTPSQTDPNASPTTTPVQANKELDDAHLNKQLADLKDPKAGHMMTEAIIPNFLTSITKQIHNEYLPYARGPYTMFGLEEFIQSYLPDALGQLLAAYRHVVSKKLAQKNLQEHNALLLQLTDYLEELLLFKKTFSEQLKTQQVTIKELEDVIGQYKSQQEDVLSEVLILREQNIVLKTELTDVICVKDMAIITLRDELQYFTKESQHWSDNVSKLTQQVNKLKQESVQKDIEIAALRAQHDKGCCEIM